MSASWSEAEAFPAPSCSRTCWSVWDARRPRFEVSPRLREEFENGRTYYPLHGRKLRLPGGSAIDRISASCGGTTTRCTLADDRAVSFPPRLSRRTRVLVFGSMPGRQSLEEQRYYAHPRNRLWRVLGDLLGFDAEAPYERRMAAALEAGVGFWDVMNFCERPGRLDAAIRRETELPNDFKALLTAHPGISVLAFNGKKAARSFARNVCLPEHLIAGVALVELPSTSPANTALSYTQLRAPWAAVLGEAKAAASTRWETGMP